MLRKILQISLLQKLFPGMPEILLKLTWIISCFFPSGGTQLKRRRLSHCRNDMGNVNAGNQDRRMYTLKLHFLTT